jgi:hypothetical protein
MMPATSRRGGDVKSPRSTPITKLELASDPYSKAVAIVSTSSLSTRSDRSSSTPRSWSLVLLMVMMSFGTGGLSDAAPLLFRVHVGW